jgi:hypothetical protein
MEKSDNKPTQTDDNVSFDGVCYFILIYIIIYYYTGVGLTTRQLAKCEWNLELASNSFKLTRQHGECLFSSSQ